MSHHGINELNFNPERHITSNVSSVKKEKLSSENIDCNDSIEEILMPNSSNKTNESTPRQVIKIFCSYIHKALRDFEFYNSKICISQCVLIHILLKSNMK